MKKKNVQQQIEIDRNLFGAVGIALLIIAAAYVFNGYQQSQNELASQQQALDATKQQLQHVQDQVFKTQQDVATKPGSSQITSDDLAPYLDGVGEIVCKRKNIYGIEEDYDSGSASLWKFPNMYAAVTNNHVIAGNDSCTLTVIDNYNLDLSKTVVWNSRADEAVIPISGPTESYFPAVSELNYKISSLRYCPSDMPQGSPVAIIGYPASAATAFAGSVYRGRTVTSSIISGYGSPNGTNPSDWTSPSYYISPTIDSGNSGGVAISKDQNGMCLLGIPTWVSTGNYANEGIVQDINNVTATQ